MSGLHIAFDHALIALSLLSALALQSWYWPRAVRDMNAGVRGARARVYRDIMAWDWALTAVVLALWVIRKRPWSDLMLGAMTPRRLGVGLAVVLPFIGVILAQRRAILARPERLERLRSRLGSAGPLLPHAAEERRLFAWLSITAGITEELFSRGFMLWYFSVWTSPLVAAALSSILFGVEHAYLGASHILRTALVGALFAGMVLAADSLWPAIVVHALTDLISGDLGYRALRLDGGPRAEPPDSDAHRLPDVPRDASPDSAAPDEQLELRGALPWALARSAP